MCAWRLSEGIALPLSRLPAPQGKPLVQNVPAVEPSKRQLEVVFMSSADVSTLLSGPENPPRVAVVTVPRKSNSHPGSSPPESIAGLDSEGSQEPMSRIGQNILAQTPTFSTPSWDRLAIGIQPPVASAPPSTSDQYLGKMTRNKDGTMTYREGKIFTATVHGDGTVSIEDGASVNLLSEQEMDIGPGVSFDVMEMIMRARGDDPYLHRKKRFLDATREARFAQAETYRQKNLWRRVSELDSKLAALWKRRDLSLAKRRHLLFVIWDDCTEQETSALRAAGDAARVVVYEFIQANLPKGSSSAYSLQELKRLNSKRMSRQRFEPYAD